MNSHENVVLKHLRRRMSLSNGDINDAGARLDEIMSASSMGRTWGPGMTAQLKQADKVLRKVKAVYGTGDPEKAKLRDMIVSLRTGEADVFTQKLAADLLALVEERIS